MRTASVRPASHPAVEGVGVREERLPSALPANPRFPTVSIGAGAVQWMCPVWSSAWLSWRPGLMFGMPHYGGERFRSTGTDDPAGSDPLRREPSAPRWRRFCGPRGGVRQRLDVRSSPNGRCSRDRPTRASARRTVVSLATWVRSARAFRRSSWPRPRARRAPSPCWRAVLGGGCRRVDHSGAYGAFTMQGKTQRRNSATRCVTMIVPQRGIPACFR